MSNINFETLGSLIILSGPSGCGKSSIAKKILEVNKNITASISYTTRPARSHEENGVDYHFVDEQAFSSMLVLGQMIEYTEIHGNYYGTPKAGLESKINEGIDILFDIEAHGAKTIKSKMPDSAISIFILPPSMEILGERLRKRAEDSEMNIMHRLQNAQNEISHIKDYDYIVINQDFDRTVAYIRLIIESERFKRSKIKNLEKALEDFFEQ